MKQFAELFMNLDRTNKTNAKVELMKNYFLTASDEDKLWALTFLRAEGHHFKVNRTMVKEWAAQEAAIPMWLFQESYQSVGDLGETISLLLPRNQTEGF
jgi:DNA ligase-1